MLPMHERVNHHQAYRNNNNMSGDKKRMNYAEVEHIFN